MKKWETTWVRQKNHPLCEGGQGRIYSVTKKNDIDSKLYILKEWKNEKRAKRFENEIDLIKKLPQHKNVISIIDFNYDQEHKCSYYVMDRADYNLEEYLNEKPISTYNILNIFLEILSGVQHIHKHNIIHRDIKPQNILMFGDVPMISDFGLSLFLLSDTRLTSTQEAIGPRYYMAPELEDGKYDANNRADIYSLGKLLYYMLSKGKIFSREKYWMPQYDLSIIYKDQRYKIFNGIFECSITALNKRYNTVDQMLQAMDAIIFSFNKHPLTLADKNLSLNIMLENPDSILDQEIDAEQAFELIRYINMNNAKVSTGLIKYLTELLVFSKYDYFTDLVDIIYNSATTFADQDKLEIIEILSKNDYVLHSIFSPRNIKGIHNLLFPVIDSLKIQTLDKIIGIISGRLSTDIEMIQRLIPYLDSLQSKTKALLILAFEDSNIDNKFTFYKDLLNAYNPKHDNEEGLYYEAILIGYLRYISIDEIETNFYSLVDSLDDNRRGCFLRALAQSYGDNKSLRISIDATKIKNSIINKAINMM